MDPVESNQKQKEEIIQRGRVEGAVAKERKRLYSILETLPAYLILLTPDYHVAFDNRFFRERFGESGGRRCFEYLFGRTEPCEICDTYTVLKTNAPHRWEWTGPDGRNYDIYDFPFTDADGSPLIMEMGIDITELKKTQAALEEANEKLEKRVAERTEALTESEVRYRNLFSSMNEGVAVHELICDAQGNPCDYRFLEVNPAFERLTGFKAKTVLGKTVLEIMPDTEPIWIDRYGKVALTGEPDHFESFSSQLNRWFEIYAYQTDPGRFAVMFLDITDRKKSEEAIHRAKEEWEKTFDSVPDLIAILDDQHRVVRANKSMADHLGCTPKQCVGLPCYKAVHGTDAPPAFCPHTQTLIDGREHTMEFQEERLGGHFLVTTTPIRDVTGRMTGSVHVARNITDLKRAETMAINEKNQLKKAEELMRESREDLHRAQAVVHAGSWRMNVLKNELLWSEENHRIFGITKGIPLTYETFLGTIHPDDREYVDRKWKAALLGEPYDIDHRIIVNGTVKWVREKAELEFDKERKLLGGFGITQDITDRKKILEAQQKSEARASLLSNTANRLLASENPQKIVNELCRKVMEFLDCHVFFNFLVDDKTGRLYLNAWTGIPDEEAARIQWLDYGVAVCGCTARDRVPIIAENIQTTPDPRTELVKSFGIQAYACHPLMIQDRSIGTLSFGTRTRAFFSPEDLALMRTIADQVAISMERIRLIGELQKAKNELETRVEERTADLQKINEALERSNRALEDFAYVASHDLQEPLRKIQIFSDRLMTLPQEFGGDKAQDYLTRMKQAAGRMRDLIQDLLAYSRITSKPDPFMVFSLRESIQEAMKDLAIRFEETQGRIEIGDLPEVKAERSQMRQLFQNLIGNALKYHSEHKPVIRVYNNLPASSPFYEIHVEDNGIGFDESHLDNIFKPFQRLHGKNSPYPGTGMGLAICRRIVEYHGGSITARSLPGKGSTFIVRLPGKRHKNE